MEAETAPYKFTISDCDVVDKDALSQFRTKRKEWLYLFEGDPDHNIRRQINDLMWSDALFRALNRLRSFGSETHPTGSHNRAIAEFIDNGYIATQVLGISKLTDPSNADATKNVVSLPRLIDDVKQSASLITRENFVCFDGLPYDYESAERRNYESLTPEQLSQFRRGPAWESGSTFTSRLVHLAFDRLATTQARTRSDGIDVSVLDDVETVLGDQSIKRVRGFRNKYVGHAADSASRKGQALEGFGFSLDDFANAQRRVIVAANVVGSILGSTVANPIPTPQYDVFENLTLPTMSGDQHEEMMQWWDEHTASRDEWIGESLERLRQYSHSSTKP